MVELLAERERMASIGKATARAIPRARLRLIEGMGHDLPPQLRPVLVDAIASNAARASPTPMRVHAYSGWSEPFRPGLLAPRKNRCPDSEQSVEYSLNVG